MAKVSQELRDRAWVGDAVLALYARGLLIDCGLHADAKGTELFKNWTSNDFLRRFGDATTVEACIGDAYNAGGIEAAFLHMDQKILPRLVEEWQSFGKQNRDSIVLSLVEKLKARLEEI